VEIEVSVGANWCVRVDGPFAMRVDTSWVRVVCELHFWVEVDPKVTDATVLSFVGVEVHVVLLRALASLPCSCLVLNLTRAIIFVAVTPVVPMTPALELTVVWVAFVTWGGACWLGLILRSRRGWWCLCGCGRSRTPRCRGRPARRGAASFVGPQALVGCFVVVSTTVWAADGVVRAFSARHFERTVPGSACNVHCALVGMFVVANRFSLAVIPIHLRTGLVTKWFLLSSRCSVGQPHEGSEHQQSLETHLEGLANLDFESVLV